jgi:hypothetical protein
MFVYLCFVILIAYHMIIHVYMDVDSTFGVVLEMWGPEAMRQRWSGSRLVRDQ